MCQPTFSIHIQIVEARGQKALVPLPSVQYIYIELLIQLKFFASLLPLILLQYNTNLIKKQNKEIYNM